MKKFICFLFLFLFLPAIVKADPKNDNSAVVSDILEQHCVYSADFTENSGPMPVSYTEYYTFDFSKISGNVGSVPSVNYTVEQQVNDGELYEVYKKEFTGADSTASNYILNLATDHNTSFSLSTFMNYYYNEESKNHEEFENSKDNGTFCPSNVYAIHDYISRDYKFMFCDGTNNGMKVDSCKNVENYIEGYKSNLVTDVNKMRVNKAKLYDHLAASGEADDPQDLQKDLGEEKKKLEQEKKDVCDENSSKYDKKRCNVLKGIHEEALGKMIMEADGYIEYTLAPIKLGEATCATFFKDGDDNYNSTHKLLSSTLKFMQYIAVIMALALSVLDFIKVVPTNDKDALMKSVKKAAMRLGIAIVIFFVPILLDFILRLVGFNSPTCGLL